MKANNMNENPGESLVASSPAKKLNWKAVVFILLIILLLISVGTYFIVQKKAKPAQEVQVIGIGEVDLTESGFVPQTVQVKAGTQVTWKSQFSSPRRIGVNPHPEHNSVSGLGVSPLLNKNDTFSFVFTKPGTYSFHDEDNPTKFQGTVIVVK